MIFIPGIEHSRAGGTGVESGGYGGSKAYLRNGVPGRCHIQSPLESMEEEIRAREPGFSFAHCVGNLHHKISKAIVIVRVELRERGPAPVRFSVSALRGKSHRHPNMKRPILK